MSKDRVITDGKLPERVCPTCGAQVVKRIMYGQLSYACERHWGPWDYAVRAAEKSYQCGGCNRPVESGQSYCSYCGAGQSFLAPEMKS